MASAFYNDDKMLQEAVAAGEIKEKEENTEIIEDVAGVFEVDLTAKTIFENNYKLIALQFPDEMLFWSPTVMLLLKKSLKILDSSSLSPVSRKIYILADTSYAPCCVDEIAGEHMNADFIVHYGRACMSKVTRLPALYVFGKKKIDTKHAAQSISTQFSSSSEKVLVFYDVGYNYEISEIEKNVNLPNTVVFTSVDKVVKKSAGNNNNNNNNINSSCSRGNCCDSNNNNENNNENNDNNEDNNNNENKSECCGGGICQTNTNSENFLESNTNNSQIDNNLEESTNKEKETETETKTEITKINGRNFELLPGTTLQDYTFLYIGEDDPTLSNLMITNSKSQFYVYNPIIKEIQKQTSMSRTIMRRYHLIERTRDADIIGIVVATLGVAGYLDVIHKLQDVIKSAGKKFYTIVVGKLNEFKLGNFQEIDIFVLVACTENTLIDSKNYYKPVITPFELEIALVRGKEWTGDYRTDFEQVLQDDTKLDETAPEETALRYSLNSQKLMKNPKHIDLEIEEGSTDIATRNNNFEVMTNSFATTFLNTRSWRGLEQHIGETPVSAPVEGRSGIASGYEGEPK